MNVTLTVQVAPAASVAPQVLDEIANRAAPVPAIVIPEMFIVASPVFWIDSAWGAVVSPMPIEKVRPVDGVNASCGCVPVPVSETSLLTSVAPVYGIVRSAASARHRSA